MFDREAIKRYLYFDVETAGLYMNLSEMSLKNPKLRSLWERRSEYYKGAFKSLENSSEEEIYQQKGGLEPEFSRVVCVSFGSFTPDGEKRFTSFYGDNEHLILSNSSKVLNNAAVKNWKLCGHNIKGFDVPCLGKRMLYNNINPPSNLRIWDKKPWELPYIDTSDIMAFGSWTHQKYLSLDLLSCSLNIDSPKENMDGSKVHKSYWTDSNYDGIKNYCELDVNTVMEVISKLCFEN